MHQVEMQTTRRSTGKTSWTFSCSFDGPAQYSEALGYAKRLMRATGTKVRVVEIIEKDVFDPRPAEV